MDKQWAEIIAPAAPPMDVMPLLWWLLPILLLALLVLYYRSRPRPAMRRRLRRLQRAPGDNESARRNTVFMLAGCLRRAYATTRLDRIDVGSRQAHWYNFIEQLQQAQYRSHPPSPAELENLLNEAREWLRR